MLLFGFTLASTRPPTPEGVVQTAFESRVLFTLLLFSFTVLLEFALVRQHHNFLHLCLLPCFTTSTLREAYRRRSKVHVLPWAKGLSTQAVWLGNVKRCRDVELYYTSVLSSCTLLLPQAVFRVQSLRAWWRWSRLHFRRGTGESPCFPHSHLPTDLPLPLVVHLLPDGGSSCGGTLAAFFWPLSAIACVQLFPEWLTSTRYFIVTRWMRNPV